MGTEIIWLAIIALVVPLSTLFHSYFTNKTINTQARTNEKLTEALKDANATIDKLIADLDGLPRRVAEQLANNILLTNVATDLRQQLIKAGIPMEDQPPLAAVEPLTPMTKEANKLVEVYQEEAKDEDEKGDVT